MADLDNDGGTSRDDLLQRIELMEKMIAEGRGFAMRKGWIFVLWGVVDLAAWSWLHLLPRSSFADVWAWPICLVAGIVLTFVGLALQKSDHGYSNSAACSRVLSVWGMMGLTLGIYVACAMVRHLTWQVSYVAGLLMIVGMAHAISAAILHWRAQGVAAALWWAGGIAVFFVPYSSISIIMLLEMCLGMIAFGLYAMAAERRGPKNGGAKLDA